MKIEFEFDSKYGVFRDALYLEDGAVLDDATIEAMKQERFNNWLYAVENPPVVDPVLDQPQEGV